MRACLLLAVLSLACRASTPGLDESGRASSDRSRDAGAGAEPPPSTPPTAETTAQPTAETTAPRPTMSFSTDALPSTLSPEQLDQVEVFYAFLSPKTGAGRQELRIKGNGDVQLLRSMAYDQPAETRDAKAPREVAHRMLDVMEDEGFFGLEDVYEQQPPTGGRFIVRVTLPGGNVKQVAVDVVPEERPPAAFAGAVAAIKLVAGLATPEAMHGRFWSTL